eukprot:CAMPEP_0119501226 /NCGR_PEP_ID=MMETSP1344-20130328/23128_1 /TAXON_ID=236787 /ORGANISM="Florenciella parvula, Strain CCMP2471" /LENGTH=34 /DNA_ID= /DNA_START= /DNA_END= /DNA_ORIENTATION=
MASADVSSTTAKMIHEVLDTPADLVRGDPDPDPA